MSEHMCPAREKLTKYLAERNAKFSEAINFGSGNVMFVIRLDKIDSRKKLGVASYAPSFCPCCGEKIT